MNLEWLRDLCLSFPGVTEDIKWGQDLCFSVAEKMFCVTDADSDTGTSFKVLPEEFAHLTQREGIIPAPYLARNHWVLVQDFIWLSEAEWVHYLRQSYDLVKAKLPKKTQASL